jgi:chromosome segregation ATPase
VTPAPLGGLYGAVSPELADRLENIERAERELAEARAEIERLEHEVEERNARINRLVEELAFWKESKFKVAMATLEKMADNRDEEIERLRQQVTQRGARMQLMREYLGRYTDGNGTLWGDFLRTKPHAASWFDADGVPK